MTTSGVDEEELLQTATVTLYNPRYPERRMEGTLVFDSGSQQSYMSQEAVRTLNLKGCGFKRQSIATFGEEKGLKQRCEVIRVGIERKEGLRPQELTLLSVPFICGALQGVSRSQLESRYPQLAQLDLADHGQANVSRRPVILIGVDFYWSFVLGKVIKCANGPVATHTTLGWVVSGPVMRESGGQPSTNLITHVLRVSSDYGRKEEERRLERKLKAFWDLESLGILDSDYDLYDQFHQIVEFRGGRYVVSLPWKDPLTSLTDNYELSLKRLRSLIRRLRQDPALFLLYDQVIREQIDQDIVEVVLNPNESKGDRVHYLPHHAVVRHNKDTTKVRVVYDARAKTADGTSLNDALLVGPKFHQRIIDILIRFRCFHTALVADIEKAFLMVGVDEGDQDVLRFLWIKDWKEEPSEVQVLRFRRVVFGVASSPFLLNATIKHHLEATHTPLVDTLLELTYVDDIILGAASPGEAFELYKKTKDMFKCGGFNLRKFVSNNSELQVKINQAESNHEISHHNVESGETYVKSMLKGSQ